MIRQRIVSTAPVDETAIEILETFAPVEIAESPDEETLLGLLEQTVGLVCRGEARVTARVISSSKDLKVIGRPGAGYDAVDIEAATARGIPVVYAPVSGFSVAEGALALLLTLVKQLPRCDRVVKSGLWCQRYEFKTGDMAEHTLGILGLGRIGSYLAKLTHPFGMTILGYDPVVSRGQASRMGVELVELRHLLKSSDFISLHVPLNEHTRGLINRETLAATKKGAILINTARGGIVESLDVLAEALESGQLSAIGLDVFPCEPPDPSHRIFQDPRCICAPHVLGVSTLAMDRIYRSMANDMLAVLKGGRPAYCVNPEVFA